MTVPLVLACHWLALFAAYKRAPAGTVILIVYLAPIGVAALAPRLLGEQVSGRTLVALLAATAGFAFVAGPTVRSAGISGLVLSWLGRRPAAETVAGGLLVIAAGVVIVIAVTGGGPDLLGEEVAAIPGAAGPGLPSAR